MSPNFKKMKYFILIFFIGLLSVPPFYGQGYSDAGACSISSLNFSGDSVLKDSRVHFSVEQSFGLGEKFILISQTTASIAYRILKVLHSNCVLHLFSLMEIWDKQVGWVICFSCNRQGLPCRWLDTECCSWYSV